MIRLTDKGWTGSSRGRWSQRRDIARDRKSGVILAANQFARTLAGDDEIIGIDKRGIGIQITGVLQMGKGKDRLVGLSRKGDGISTEGNIAMQGGDDVIIGSGKKEGIRNDTVISMGRGNDELDASRGGFGGVGSIFLDGGNDTLRGFGRQDVFGGSGRDVALLLEGTYTIRHSGSNPNVFRVSKKGTTLSLFGFERIGSNRTDDTLGLRSGTLLVAANGDLSYI
jgi:hypothetical protein